MNLKRRFVQICLNLSSSEHDSEPSVSKHDNQTCYLIKAVDMITG
jgi:hypothetical protein